MTKWDARYLGLAELMSTWSKDPSKQVGAAIMRPDKTVASTGFNGLPSSVPDTPAVLHDRQLKLELVVHAEINAIQNALWEDLRGYTMFVFPLPPCAECADRIIHEGIQRVVAPAIYPESRWFDSCTEGRAKLEAAGVEVEWVRRWDD